MLEEKIEGLIFVKERVKGIKDRRANYKCPITHLINGDYSCSNCVFAIKECTECAERDSLTFSVR